MKNPVPEYRNSALSADRALASVKDMPPLKTGIVHPVKASSIIALKEAVDET